MSERIGNVYLQVRRDPSSARHLRVVRATQSPPSTVESDCIVVRLQLRIPDKAFSPLDAILTVPEEFVWQGPVEAEAVDANEQ